MVRLRNLIFLILPALIACSGLAGSPNAAAPSGALDTVNAPQAVPGAQVGETATKFDPEGSPEYGFLETDHKLSRQGDGYVTELHGQVFHLGKNALFKNNEGSTPCCEGQWLMARDTLHHTCGAAVIGKDGDWKGAVPAGDPLLPNLLFYLGNENFAPGSEGILGDCSNVNPDQWTKYPIGYIPPAATTGVATFADSPNDKAVDGIVHPASSGIQSVKSSGPISLPNPQSIDFSRPRFQFLPSTGSNSDTSSDSNSSSDSDSNSGEKVVK